MKRALILFELVIALALSAILLSLLLRFFAHSAAFDRKLDEARAQIFARQHLHTRLSAFFTSTIPRSALPSSALCPFHTPEAGRLTAVFDNGIDPDPAFSGPIVGTLFIDGDANLSLTLFPLDAKEGGGPCRKEILMSRASRLRFQFLAKKNSQHPDPNATPILPSLEWRTNWPKTRWDIPSLIRIFVEQQGEPIAFSFALPIADPIPTYYDAT
jgi:hypothetical protein